MSADELGEYRVVRPLGRGGMGQVFLGHDTLLDRPVAIKVIAARAPSAEARERFFTEARAVARLSHPNVVAIHRVAETFDGRPYLVQELVRGVSLDQLPRPMPWREVRDIGLGIARGLAAAHRRGVLHRDVKPANVMRTHEGIIKLLDFGLAKLGVADGLDVAVGLDEPPLPPAASAAGASPPTASLPRAETPGGAALAATFAAPLLRRHSAVAETADGSEVPSASPPHADGFAAAPSPGVTQPGALMGTPRYMAPELWAAEVATVRSDLYATGALLYELVTGRPVHDGEDFAAVRDAALGSEPAAVGSLVPDVEPRLAALIARCLARDPASRPASADALAHELELVGTVAPETSTGNPYRGLRPFDAEDRSLFFGRGVEVSMLLDRLRAEPIVIVGGDSGVGKSSLCRAGVLPAVEAGALGEERPWTTTSLTPGRTPRAALTRAMEGVAEGVSSAKELARSLGASGRGWLLFVDQAEELVTLASGGEAESAARLLAELAACGPTVRVLLAVRGDFLTRLAALPALGPLLARGLSLIGPLDEDGLREAVVGPARARGVTFESPTMVDELVADARGPGGLPLLQFALAELWPRRRASAVEGGGVVLPASALTAIGGVPGALTRHADGLLSALAPAAREAARHVLVRLVTVDDTSASRTAAELTLGDPAAAGALDALVSGRIVVAHDTAAGASYRLAHDALIHGWSTLRTFLDEVVGQRALRARLDGATADWVRRGRPRDGLWGPRQLGEAAALSELGAPQQAFLAASRRAARVAFALRVGLVMAAPALAGAVYLGIRWRDQAARERAVAAHVGDADVALAEGRALDGEVGALRRLAFTRFDADATSPAEEPWEQSRARGAEARRAYRRAGAALEAALLVDAGAALRLRMAEVLFEEARLAERDHESGDLDDLLQRLSAYDDGSLRARWDAPARLVARVEPAAPTTLRCFTRRDGRRVLGEVLAQAADGRLSAELPPPASCVVEVEAPGGPPVRLPFFATRGEEVHLTLRLPPRAAWQSEYAYVPEGQFLYGSAHDEGMRHELHAQPEHPVTTAAFWVARRETTYAEWMAFLAALPPEEAAARTPRTLGNYGGALELRDGRTFAFRRGDVLYLAGPGEPMRYRDRSLRAEQRWERFPVAGVSFEDAHAYAAWLDRTGAVPGARLCSAREWERATRGADDRRYPHGDVLGDDDTNHDATYGRKPAAFGPDEVGSHPVSDSPFGVSDLAGNVWEWVVGREGAATIRGGGWYDGALSSLAMNRDDAEPKMRDPSVGVRVCASAAAPR